jgi:hypothetical protein
MHCIALYCEKNKTDMRAQVTRIAFTHQSVKNALLKRKNKT